MNTTTPTVPPQTCRGCEFANGSNHTHCITKNDPLCQCTSTVSKIVSER